MHAKILCGGLAATLLAAGCGGSDAQVQPLSPDCNALASLALPDTVIKSATRIAAGAASSGEVKMPEHCLLQAEIGARTGVAGVRYATNMELRLPLQWNGRFQFQGGGGVDGVLPTAFGTLRAGVMPALSQGAAVVTSDMGHQGTSTRDASFGADPQARIDWGYNSVDQVTVRAKDVIGRFYGRAPDHSYYVGCSGGGRQGMMAAQRLPQHFDGVVSGAPILEQHLAQVGSMVALQLFTAIAPKNAAGEPILSRAYSDADLKLIADGVIRRCDALDGAADGIIEKYPSCTYDVSELQCTGAKTDACLSREQVTAFNQVMAGPKNSAGTQLYPAVPWDTGISGTGWRNNWIGTSTTAVPNPAKYTNQSIRMVFMTPPAPDFDYLKFNVDTDPARMSASASFSTTNGVNYDGFKARGGKTIVYTGLSDTLVNPAGVNRWYRNLVDANGGLESTQTFARFFNVPGLEHCSGGRGMDIFDPVTAIYDWVEKGIAPQTMPARSTAFAGRTRNLCTWPQVAQYSGSGSVDDAANFRCVAP